MNNITATIKDFCPFNKWTEDHQGPKWTDTGDSKFIVDNSTGKKYWNEEAGVVRTKCALLIPGSFYLQPIKSSIKVSSRVFNLVSFAYFRDTKKAALNPALKDKLNKMYNDVLKIAVHPLASVSLGVTAIYGLFSPYDARKIYASIERVIYDGDVNSYLAPCFQPNPHKHRFGGNPEQQNTF